MDYSLIIPIYNEEEMIDELFRRLMVLNESLSERINVEFIFVDDGSRDRSLEKLSLLAKTNKQIKILKIGYEYAAQ